MEPLKFVTIRNDPEAEPVIQSVQGTPLKYFIPDFNEILVKHFIAQNHTPALEDLMKPITWNGNTYTPCYLGSTSSKAGHIYYCRIEDAPKLLSTFADAYIYADYVYRQMRAFAPRGANTFGYVEGKLRIKVVPEGTVVHGIEIRDGCAVGKLSSMPQQGEPIVLRAMFNHFNYWHRMKWAVVEPAVIECVKNLREDIANGDFDDLVTVLMRMGLEDGLREKFITVAPPLARHPFMRDNISDLGQRIMSSNATAPYIKEGIGDYVAVPYKYLTLPLGEKYIVARQPIISPRSCFAAEGTGKTLPPEVVGSAVATYTGKRITDNKLITIKANIVLIDDDDIDADIVTCIPNVKIGEDIGFGTFEFDGVLSFIQKYARESLLGIPWDMLKTMNGDGDGDLIGVVHILEYLLPFWEETKRLSKGGQLFKFPKAKEKVKWSEKEAMKMIRNGMLSDMGWSTMLQFWFWSMGDEILNSYTTELHNLALGIWNAMGMRETPPKCSVEGIDEILTVFIQYNIDPTKSRWCDPTRTRRAAAKFQAKLLRLMGKSAGYTSFKRGRAYQNASTCFMSELPEDFIASIKVDPKIKQSWTWKMSIPDGINGLPVQYYRLVRADIDGLFRKFNGHEQDPIDHRSFANWASNPGREYMDHGWALVELFSHHIALMESARQSGDFHPEIHEEIHQYRDEWVNTVNKYIRDHGLQEKRMFVAQGLWRTSHLQPEQQLSGAVFIGMTDEAFEIAKGWRNGVGMARCVLIGVKAMYQDVGRTPPVNVDAIADVFIESGNTYVAFAAYGEEVILKCREVDNNTVKLGYRHPAEGKYHMKADILPSSTAYSAAFEPE